MHVFADPFWVQKDGSDVSEYEDAYWPSFPVDKDAKRHRFAVADGATETSFSKNWANLLVEGYYHRELDKSRIMEGLPRLQAKLRAAVDTNQLPWYADEKAREGAFSSILGLRIGDTLVGQPRQWYASAVGDTCVVQMRGESVRFRFPLTEATAFNNRPMLLSSNPAYNPAHDVLWRTTHQAWESEDIFFLMTDALALWFYTEFEKGRKPWIPLRDLRSDEDDFTTFVHDLRATKSIRNDDVTLLRISVV